MSVLPMKRVLIAGLRKDRKKILEFLQRQGVVQIETAASEDDIFKKQDRSQASAAFRKNAALSEQALEILNVHAPEKSSLLSALDGRKELTREEYEQKVEGRDEGIRKAQDILDLGKQYDEARAEVPKLESQLVALRPWMNYDLPLDFDGTKKAAVFTGSLPGGTTLEQAEALLREYAPDADDVDISLISQEPEQTCVFVVAGRKHENEVRDALRRMNFAKPPLSSMDPKKTAEELETRIGELRQKQTSLEEQIRGYESSRDDLKFMSDYFTMRADKYDVISGLAQSRSVFLVQGWIEERYADSLEAALTSRFDVVFETEKPGEQDEPPEALQNNGFVNPVESVVESYSLPSKHEFDPSTLVALFYYVLFGMMLSDAGYGLIMTIGCGLALAKKKNMEAGMRKTLKMFLYCGISTMFWGFMFGSFFGDAVNVIATTFFGRPDIKLPALWFEQLSDPMKMLSFCFLVAIIHLFVGLGALAYTDIRNGQILDAFYDVVLWYLFVGGCILYLLTMPMMATMLKINPLPAAVGQIGKWMAIVGFIGVVLTGGRESKNWGKRILKGLYAAYGITSWLSDILSYSRLLALGLATGVIAQVFNKMGSMVAAGKGVAGVIVFILIFVIGHVLNLLINALGAYVHTNRLEYVEFFGKFYNGGGEKFVPFAQNTKYYKIKEEV